MDPKSPPDPLTYSTSTVSPVNGSRSRSFADVLPPPKLVTVKSDPNRLDRYRSRDLGSSAAAWLWDQMFLGVENNRAEFTAPRSFDILGESLNLGLKAYNIGCKKQSESVQSNQNQSSGWLLDRTRRECRIGGILGAGS